MPGAAVRYSIASLSVRVAISPIRSTAWLIISLLLEERLVGGHRQGTLGKFVHGRNPTARPEQLLHTKPILAASVLTGQDLAKE